MYYVYSGRFQPFSKLNEQELQWLVKNIKSDDKIIIGIVNPMPQFIASTDNADTWVRFKLEYNPLSYWERYIQIKNYIDKNNLSDKVYSITPLPRPSKNMLQAANYLPSKENRIMCLPIVHDSEQEEEKKEGLEKQGESPFVIPSETFDPEYKIISPELIFCLMAINNNSWKRFVNKDVELNLTNLNLQSRFSERGLSRDKAIETLKKIYKRINNSEEADIFYDILKNDIVEIQPSIYKKAEIRERNQNIDNLNRKIDKLIEEIECEIPSLRKDAPQQYNVFKQIIRKLYNHLEAINNNIADDQINQINNEIEDIRIKWEERNR